MAQTCNAKSYEGALYVVNSGLLLSGCFALQGTEQSVTGCQSVMCSEILNEL